MIIGVGMDMVQIERLGLAIERQGRRFINRIYTEGERAFCVAHADPLPYYASRFAAKEAAAKALGTGITGGIHWTDIEVVRVRPDPPSLVLRGLAKVRFDAMGATRIWLTMSHTADFAIAQVILELV